MSDAEQKALREYLRDEFRYKSDRYGRDDRGLESKIEMLCRAVARIVEVLVDEGSMKLGDVKNLFD